MVASEGTPLEAVHRAVARTLSADGLDVSVSFTVDLDGIVRSRNVAAARSRRLRLVMGMGASAVRTVAWLLRKRYGAELLVARGRLDLNARRHDLRSADGGLAYRYGNALAGNNTTALPRTPLNDPFWGLDALAGVFEARRMPGRRPVDNNATGRCEFSCTSDLQRAARDCPIEFPTPAARSFDELLKFPLDVSLTPGGLLASVAYRDELRTLRIDIVTVSSDKITL
jgi:hypothetical protein